MRLLWLICQLTVTTASPVFQLYTIGSFWKLLNMMDEMETKTPQDHARNQEHKICETAHCYEIASKILQNRDVTADPCEDFYQYACGLWEKHNPIPETELEWSEDEMILYKTQERIRDALEEPDDPADILPVKMARKLYRSCMNVDTIEERGIKPIQEILDQNGGWPMAMPLNKWDADKFSWQKIDKHYSTLIEDSAFYALGYEVDKNDTKKYILTLSQQTEYPMPYQEVSTSYGFYLFQTVRIFAKDKGYVLNKDQLKTDVIDLIRFGYKLSEILGTEAGLMTDDNYRRMTIEDLQNSYNDAATSSQAKMDFLELIQHIFKLANIKINASEPIIVYNPEFLFKLANLLATTPSRVLVNYLHWNMVEQFLSYTTQAMRDLQWDTSSTYNISYNKPRWKICMENMEMEDAISYMFVKRYISDEVINEVTKMTQKIRDELSHRIIQAHWIPGRMKTILTEKMKTLQTQIGYPDWYNNDNAVIEYYEGLEIGTDYFKNILKCNKHSLIKILNSLRKPVSAAEWWLNPIAVNAYYLEKPNSIIITAAELQDPFFTPSLPEAVNYGTTGFVIGHELSHSLNNDSIYYDKDGYMISSKIQDITSREYEERASCFSKQYSNYTLDVKDEDSDYIKLDGELTKDENLADTIGIQIAYKAFKAATKHKHHSRLPGLEHITSDELFFLSFANSWCAASRPEYEANTVNTDEHSPPKYRIIGSLSNLPEFSKTFKCPSHSAMNPQHRCIFWN